MLDVVVIELASFLLRIGVHRFHGYLRHLEPCYAPKFASNPKPFLPEPQLQPQRP